MLPTTITLDWLVERGAYKEQREAFAREWPDGAELSEASLLRAAVLGLDLGWLAKEMLPAPLWAEYVRQRAPLWAEYERQRAALLTEYERERAALLTEYERQSVALWAEYLRQAAALLWRLIARARGPEGRRGGLPTADLTGPSAARGNTASAARVGPPERPHAWGGRSTSARIRP